MLLVGDTQHQLVAFIFKSQTTKTHAISVMLFKVDNWTQRSRSTARNIRELAEKLSAIILSELYINKLFTPKLPYQVVKYFLPFNTTECIQNMQGF